jgi:hypothetical protein
VYVRLEQGQAHFAQGCVDIGLGKFAAPAELVKDLGQASSKCLKHQSLSM